MLTEELKNLVKEIVEHTRALKDRHTLEKDAPVNYACVFTQSQSEYEMLVAAARQLGAVVKETTKGQLFRIVLPLKTSAGELQLLKIRVPDPTRPERGDADFTIADYPTFKNTVLSRPEFKLIQKEGFEMIELMDPSFKVRAYFSHPPLDQQLRLRTL